MQLNVHHLVSLFLLIFVTVSILKSTLAGLAFSAQKNVSSTDKKVPSEQLECFADYLVMIKGAKTEIFAEKVREEGKWRWRMRRAVMRQAKLEKLNRVYERQMAEDIGERRADECFTRNREMLSIQEVKGEDKVAFFVKIWELFDRSANGRLQVSDGLSTNLGAQSKCLVEFLTQTFGLDHLYEQQLEEARHRRRMLPEEKIAVLNVHNVIDIRNANTSKLLRWKWAGEKKMPKKIRFKEGTAQFSALAKCEKIVPLKSSIRKDGTGRSFIVLNPLLARFRVDQLFIGEMPKIRNNFTIGHLAMLKQGQCTICQEKFKANDQLQQFYSCRHVFHQKCIDKWFETKYDCPICRKTVNFELLHEHFKHEFFRKLKKAIIKQKIH